jgi:hypothetical protein
MNDRRGYRRSSNVYGTGAREGDDWTQERSRYGSSDWSARDREGYGDRDRERWYGRGSEGSYGGPSGTYRDDERYGRADERDEPSMWERMKGEMREGWESLSGNDENDYRMRRGQMRDEYGYGGGMRRDYPYGRMQGGGYGGGYGGGSTGGYGGGREHRDYRGMVGSYGGGIGSGGYGYGGGIGSGGYGGYGGGIGSGGYGGYGGYGSESYRDRGYGERMRSQQYDERGPWERAKEGLREGWEDLKETFAGKGPRGYKRSDDRIREDVSDRLTRHPAVDASDIEVAVRSGEVTLSGSVPERRMKRLAEDVVEEIDGVHDVTNQIRVTRAIETSTRDFQRDNGIVPTTTTTTGRQDVNAKR